MAYRRLRDLMAALHDLETTLRKEERHDEAETVSDAIERLEALDGDRDALSERMESD
jgi:hypothetical protein